MVLAAAQPQDPYAGAVVDRGVLKPFAPAPGDDLHVHLDRIAGMFLFKELQLLGAAPPRFH